MSFAKLEYYLNNRLSNNGGGFRVTTTNDVCVLFQENLHLWLSSMWIDSSMTSFGKIRTAFGFSTRTGWPLHSETQMVHRTAMLPPSLNRGRNGFEDLLKKLWLHTVGTYSTFPPFPQEELLSFFWLLTLQERSKAWTFSYYPSRAARVTCETSSLQPEIHTQNGENYFLSQ